jgi:acetyltransferase
MQQGPIEIRRIRPRDARKLETFYAGMSPHSRATRFMCGTRGISADQAVKFASAPLRGADGFVGIDGSTGEIVGHLCLEMVRLGVGEVGVATTDRWQGRGIGRSLLKAAVASARRRGTHTFEATMLRGNPGIHRLLQRSGIPWRRRPLDFVTELLTLDLDAAAAA